MELYEGPLASPFFLIIHAHQKWGRSSPAGKVCLEELFLSTSILSYPSSKMLHCESTTLLLAHMLMYQMGHFEVFTLY